MAEQSGNEHMGRFRVIGNSRCITVPKYVREKLGWMRGDWLMLVISGDTLLVRRVSRSAVFATRTIDTRAVQAPQPTGTPRLEREKD